LEEPLLRLPHLLSFQLGGDDAFQLDDDDSFQIGGDDAFQLDDDDDAQPPHCPHCQLRRSSSIARHSKMARRAWSFDRLTRVEHAGQVHV
jgi:hypothetical protein